MKNYSFWQMNRERKDEWELIIDDKAVAYITKYEDGYECFDCISKHCIEAGITNLETAFEIMDTYMWDTYGM